MTNPPHIPRSVFSITRWLVAAQERHDPTGWPIQRLRWFDGPIECILPYAFAVDSYCACIVVSGTAPTFLAEDPTKPSSARWRLATPCVVTVATLDHERRVYLEVTVVANRRELGQARKKLKLPQSELMRALSRVANLPKRDQQRLAKPEGGDQDGD